MPQYVEKLRVGVRVSQPGQEPFDGMFSVSPQAEFRDGPESILERLNASERVIPLTRFEDGAVLLVARTDIEWVAAGPRVERALVCPPAYRVTREERVRVRLMSGEELEGLLQIELPDQLNRASDFLNGSDDFFALVRPVGVYLINKLRVSNVLVYESSPLPVAPGQPA